MSAVPERGAIGRDPDALVSAPSARRWLFATGRVAALLLAVVAGIGLIGGAMRANVPLIVLGWSVLSFAAAALYALARAQDATVRE